jgi:hypothetical protein
MQESMEHTQGEDPSLQIPVIDISKANATTAARLSEAVAEYGFVFVNGGGLGFTSGILEETFALVRSEQEPLHACIPYIGNTFPDYGNSHNVSSYLLSKKRSNVQFEKM